MAKHTAPIQASVARTASYTGADNVACSVNKLREGTISLNVTAVSGTDCSGSVVVQDYVGGAWHDLVTFNAATAVSKQVARNVTSFGTKMRALLTLTGTGDLSFTYSVYGVFDRAI